MVGGQAEGEDLIIAELGVGEYGLQRVPEVFLRHVSLLRDCSEETVQDGKGEWRWRQHTESSMEICGVGWVIAGMELLER